MGTNDEGGASVGNIFYGSEGYLVVKGYDSYEIFLGQKREPGPTRTAGGDHFANFVKAVRSRKTSDQNGPVETAIWLRHWLTWATSHTGSGVCSTFDPANRDVRRRQRGERDADPQVPGAVHRSGKGLSGGAAAHLN